MSQTLTKPILLDETGQAIKQALQNIDETEAQDWLLTYEDVHSEMDDTLAAIAGSLEEIKDVIANSEYYPEYISSAYIGNPRNPSVGTPFSENNVKTYAHMLNDRTSETKMIDITNACTYSLKDGDLLGPENCNVSVTWVYGKTGIEYTTICEIDVFVPTFASCCMYPNDYMKNVLNAHYAGAVNLHNYWSVGDESDVVKIQGTLGGENTPTSASQKYEKLNKLVILEKGGKDLVTPINGHTECAFIIGFEWGIAEEAWATDTTPYVSHLLKYQFDSNNSFSGNWSDSELRTWCNTTLKSCRVGIWQDEITESSDVIPLFKQFINKSANPIDSQYHYEEITTQDYFAVTAEKELYGECTYGQDAGEASLSQFEYYKTAANRVLKYTYADQAHNNFAQWWGRSVCNVDGVSFDINGYSNAGANLHAPTDKLAVIAFGVI